MSHHSDGGGPGDTARREEMIRKLKDSQRDLEGEFPRGRLNPDDQGAVVFAVSCEGDVVRLDAIGDRLQFIRHRPPFHQFDGVALLCRPAGKDPHIAPG